MPDADNPLRPEKASATTVWAQIDAVLVVGPEPGPGNSEGGEAVLTNESAEATSYAINLPVPILLHVSAAPGPGDSDGGGFDPPGV